jgi:hypothetical protein
MGKQNVTESLQEGNEWVSTIHLSLQGKGGVGKSLVASILAQYLQQRGMPVRCVDTDPVNKTLSQYRGLPTEQLKLLREGGIDQRAFDDLMQQLLTQDAATFVVDNGASTFIPLWNYILENSVHRQLRDARKRLFVHTVITGGQALLDTLNGFSQLAESTTEQNIIVWVNEYFGRVEHEGKQFADMKVFHDNEHRVFGTVAIIKRNQDTFGRDMEDMITQKLTFVEAVRDSEFTIMAKQRLKVIERDIFEQLDQLAIF